MTDNAADPFDTKSQISMHTSLSKQQKREDTSLNILTRKALNQLLDTKGEEIYPDKVSNKSSIGLNSYLSKPSTRNGP